MRKNGEQPSVKLGGISPTRIELEVGGLFPLKGNLGDHGAFNSKDLTLIHYRFLF